MVLATLKCTQLQFSICTFPLADMIPIDIPESGNEVLTVDQGQAYILDLPYINSKPRPSVTWYEVIDQGSGAFPTQRTILTEAQRYQITLNNQLIVLATRLSDNDKKFKARAMNSHSGQMSESQKYVLKVQSKYQT